MSPVRALSVYLWNSGPTHSREKDSEGETEGERERKREKGEREGSVLILAEAAYMLYGPSAAGQ